MCGVVVAIAPAGVEVVVEEPRDLRRQPGRHVGAVRDRADRPLVFREPRPDRPPHLTGDFPVKLADGVGRARGPQGERGHVEERPAAVVVVAERHERVAVRAERAPGVRQVRLDEAERKRVVAGRDRRVRREDRRAPDFFERGVERVAALEQVADALQHDERRVPFVEVPRGRRRAHRLQRADAADAEDDLLLHARFAVAAVEPRGQLAVPRGVLFQIGVEQIQRHPAEPDAPHRYEDAAVAERHGDDARLPVGRDGRLDRRVRPREALVGLLLPAFRGDALMEIALRVHEPDADERNTEVARLLAVIAREDAEAAGVDRQRLMERELGREIRDRPLCVRVAVLPPRVARAPRVVQRLDGRVVHRQKPLVLRREVEHLLRNRPEHQHGVVRGLPPEGVVELAEHLAGLRVPGPPEIGRQLGKPAQAFGDRQSGHSIQSSPFR